MYKCPYDLPVDDPLMNPLIYWGPVPAETYIYAKNLVSKLRQEKK